MNRQPGSGRSVLVTGAAGSIGSRLCRAMLESGCRVAGVDDFFSGLRENIEPLAGDPNFTFLERDVCEPGLLAALNGMIGPFGAVLHMAAVVSAPWSLENPERTDAVNRAAALALHGEARRLGVGAFVFAGSAAEYGLPLAGPAREGMAGEPQTPYGRSKFLATRAIEASGYGCALRLFNVYGPMEGNPGPYDGVVRRFLDAALRGEPFAVHGDGGQTRDFVHVDDVVRALLHASGVWGNEPLRGVFNYGTGRATSVAELAGMVAAVAGRELVIRHLPERPGDLHDSQADMGRARAAGLPMPETRLEDGLRATWKRLKELGGRSG
ncbi:NAD-dependent epimerase/dehydratase family protein [Fundidesulfovibrio agrisoli]|uniref:NAD-dependent epimerase/dehydratase family protein n=1 Tax=Fundidesulfovibrio agrisoli TaxID=2922717 RepID=UPI001FABD1BF|nr:NAD-dependent epimerase/dehydratase family protein [Fundidesulfovibrio agrisoli]